MRNKDDWRKHAGDATKCGAVMLRLDYSNGKCNRFLPLRVALAALVGRGDAHVFAIFRHRAARQLDSLCL